MPRKRSGKVTNVRFRKNEQAVKPHWKWIQNQSNLKLSVLDAIAIVEKKLGPGDLHKSLIDLAGQAFSAGMRPNLTNNTGQSAYTNFNEQPAQTRPTIQRPVSTPKRPAAPKRPATPKPSKPAPQTKPAHHSTRTHRTTIDVSHDAKGNGDAAKAIFTNLHGNNK